MMGRTHARKSSETNGKSNGTPISEVTDEDINAVNYYGKNRGGFRGNNESYRGYHGNNNRVVKIAKCQAKTLKIPMEVTTRKEEAEVEKNTQRGGKNSSFMQGVFCEFCGKEGHRENKCCTTYNCEKHKNQKLNAVTTETQDDQQPQHDLEDYYEVSTGRR